jgi:sugar lactone lactonase YvrE
MRTGRSRRWWRAATCAARGRPGTLPVKQTSSVAFGGADLSGLYVTSAAGYWPSSLTPAGFDESAPMGGSLYRVRTDVCGAAVPRSALLTAD